MLKSVFDFLDVLVEPNANALGVPYDQIKCIITLLVTIVFSAILRFIKTEPSKQRPKSMLQDMAQNKLIYLKHFLSLFIGVEILLFMYHDQIINSFVSSLIVYLILKYFPKETGYKAAIIFSMLFMLGSHIYIMITAYMSWAPDFTAPQMVLTIKMTAYAFAYHDGFLLNKSEKVKEKSEKNNSAGNTEENDVQVVEKFTPRMKEYAIREQPNIIEFFAWTYFAPGLLAGPAIEYADYMNYMTGKMFENVPGKKIPFSMTEILKRVAYFIVFLLITLLFSGYGYSWLSNVILEDKIKENGGLVFVSLRLLLCGPIHRSKYYVVWMLGEIACLICGISFSGMKKSPSNPEVLVPTWEKGIAAKPLLVEFGSSCKVIVDNWNIGTEKWLRYYINDRLVGTKFEKNKRILTYIVSAFWHGLYPGYYFFFVAAGIFANIAHFCRKRIRPYAMLLCENSKAWQFVYDVMTWFASMIVMDYAALQFYLLDGKLSFISLKNTYFYLYIITAAWYILVHFIPPYKPKEDPKKEN